MISYTCDLCGRTMIENDPLRFVVKIEIFAARDPLELCDDDLIDDRRDELAQMQDVDEQLYQSHLYDLCRECRQQYQEDPLFRKKLYQRPRHSDN